MSELKEYIVTLHRHEDLEGFYEDMETPGGDLYIPDRKVEVSNRLDSSRNTHYYLTQDEVDLIRKDSRVIEIDVVSNSSYERTIRPCYEITSSGWDKNYGISGDNSWQNDINWGILACSEEGQDSNLVNNWGVVGATPTEVENNPSGTANSNLPGTATVTFTATGKNVDVVIADIGHPNPYSPEFAVNADGTGGSRFVQYNWFQHTVAVRGSGSNGTYLYPTLTTKGSDNGETFKTATAAGENHGSHVAGIAAGNTIGWARDANVYGFNVRSSDSVGPVPPHLVFRYILEFHRNKPINPLTGIKNPTIVNNSWGEYALLSRPAASTVHYRGQDYSYTSSGTLSTDLQEFVKYGIRKYDSTYDEMVMLASRASTSAEMEACINEGIILVGASANEWLKIDSQPIPDDTTRDYYNTITGSFWDHGIQDYATKTEYIHRGTVGASSSIICVSNVGNQVSNKRAFRINTGPRVDIYAPGVAIKSIVHTASGGPGYSDYPTVDDSRTDVNNTNYYDSGVSYNRFAKWSFDGSGATSQASPQVTGMLACILEHYPRMNQQDCRDFLINTAIIGKIGGSTSDAAPPNLTTPGDAGVDWENDESLFGGENRYLYYKKQRETQGYVTAQLTNNVRKTSGMMFPRRRHI